MVKIAEWSPGSVWRRINLSVKINSVKCWLELSEQWSSDPSWRYLVENECLIRYRKWLDSGSCDKLSLEDKEKWPDAGTVSLVNRTIRTGSRSFSEPSICKRLRFQGFLLGSKSLDFSGFQVVNLMFERIDQEMTEALKRLWCRESVRPRAQRAIEGLTNV